MQQFFVVNHYSMLFGIIACIVIFGGQLFMSDAYAINFDTCNSEIFLMNQQFAGRNYNMIELNCDNTVTGSAYVFNSDHSSIALTRPVILLDGFDPGNKRGLEFGKDGDGNFVDGLYDQFNNLNMIDTILDEGYSVIILDFDEGAGDIRHNAFLLAELIVIVNSNIDDYDEIVVVGPSMGGLISRYALTYMENEQIDHNVRLFISFDVPHQGANVPLGNQYFLQFFSLQDDGAKKAIDIINTVAAKQMLVYHHTYDSLNPSKVSTTNRDTRDMTLLLNPPGPNSFFHDFFQDLVNLGNYPQNNVRKIAISNGAGDGTRIYPEGKLMVYHESTSQVDNWPDTDVAGTTWALSNIPILGFLTPNMIFGGMIDWGDFGGNDHDKVNVTTANSILYDIAPGGYASISAEIASTGDSGTTTSFVDYETFIPTISALDIDTDDLFYDIQNDNDILSITPFNAIYYPDSNQKHVEITAQNKLWIICEIFSIKPSSYDQYCLDTGIAEEIRSELPDNISNNANYSTNPSMSAYYDDIGIVWEECSDCSSYSEILFTHSIDAGDTWESILSISGNNKKAKNPQIVISNSTYIVWEENAGEFNNVFFRASRDVCTQQPCLVFLNPVDNVFHSKRNLDKDASISTSPKIIAYHDQIYVIWGNSLNNATGDIFFRASNDGGFSWDPPLNQNPMQITDGTNNAKNPKMVLSANSNNVYILWQQNVNGQTDIFFRASNDWGLSFNQRASLSDSQDESKEHNISILKNDSISVMWTDGYDSDIHSRLNSGMGSNTSWHPPILETPLIMNSDTSSSYIDLSMPSLSSNNASVLWSNMSNTIVTRYGQEIYYSEQIDSTLSITKINADTIFDNVDLAIDQQQYVIGAAWSGDDSVYNTCGYPTPSHSNSQKISKYIVDTKNPSIKIIVNHIQPPPVSHIVWQGVELFSNDKSDIFYEKLECDIDCDTYNLSMWNSNYLCNPIQSVSGIPNIVKIMDDFTLNDDFCEQIDCNWNPEIIASMGYEFLKMNKLDIGKAFFNEAIKRDNTNVKILTTFANLLVKNNDLTSAKELYEKSIKINPNYIDAHNGLTYVYFHEYENAITQNDSSLIKSSMHLTKYHNDKAKDIDPKNKDVITATSKINSIPSSTTSQSLEYITILNTKIIDMNKQKLSSSSIDQEILISTYIKNNQDDDQKYVYIVQIKDADDVLISLTWTHNVLAPDSAFSPYQSWTPTTSGDYTATIFVWESIDNLVPLSPPNSIKISVK